jgi:histidine ammonia-lyase
MEPMYKTQEKKEGKITKLIEEQTSKLPSDIFLWASVGVMSAAMILQLVRQKHMSLFIGQWAAPFLLFGIYNKLVKQFGHDKAERD